MPDKLTVNPQGIETEGILETLRLMSSENPTMMALITFVIAVSVVAYYSIRSGSDQTIRGSKIGANAKVLQENSRARAGFFANFFARAHNQTIDNSEIETRATVTQRAPKR